MRFTLSAMTPLLAAIACASSAHAQFLPFGDGCAGTIGTPRLFLPTGQNVAGTIQVRAEPLQPTANAALLVGFRRKQCAGAQHQHQSEHQDIE